MFRYIKQQIINKFIKVNHFHSPIPLIQNAHSLLLRFVNLYVSYHRGYPVLREFLLVSFNVSVIFLRLRLAELQLRDIYQQYQQRYRNWIK
jgi:hypothetical protein